MDVQRDHIVEETSAHYSDSGGWQLGLSILQCNEYMYQSKMGADVCFNLASDASSVKVWAHSYMLMSRSPVFERLLKEEWCGAYGDIAPEGIDITDIDKDAFNEMLRYIYYEKICLHRRNSFSTLHAAKKYKLMGLLSLCKAFILNNISPETVCEYLTQSISYEEQEIEEACLSYVTKEAAFVLQSEGVLKLSKEALLKIVQQDDLNVENEKQVYDACIRWAMKICDHEDAGVTHEVIRSKLGEVFHHIRFPCMSKGSLSEITKTTSMLSKEEQLDILWSMLDPESQPCSFVRKQRLSQRRPPQGQLTESVIRFDHADMNLEYHITEASEQANAISFTVSRNVCLVGISLFVGDIPMHVLIDVMENSKEIVAQSKPRQHLTQDQCDIFINDINVSYFMFDTHVNLEANQLYTLMAKIKYLQPPESKTVFLPRGTKGRQTVRSKSGAIVTFWNAVSVPHNATTIEEGQFPQLLFTESK